MTIPILYCLVSGSAITDILKNKIFNVWLLLGCMARMVICIADSHTEGAFLLLAKAGITILLLLPVYMIRGIGGGDIKLFAVLSMFLSSGEFISSVIIAFFIAAVFGMTKMLMKKNAECTIHMAVPILISVLTVTGCGKMICS